MYAIIQVGSKQYRVAKDEVIDVELLGVDAGKPVEFKEVLYIGGDEPAVGVPFIKEFVVKGEVVATTAGPKLSFMKYRPSHHERKTYGHKQKYSRVKITGIEKVGRKEK